MQQTIYHNVITAKMHFIKFNFKFLLKESWIPQSFSMRWFMVEFSNHVANFKICGWVFDVLILWPPLLSFEFVPSFWCELEENNHFYRDMLWHREAIFEKPVQTVVGMIHAQLTRTEEVSFREKYHVLINLSKEYNFCPVIRRDY